MASTPDRPKGKSLSDLGMVWEFARHYPGHIACAAIALLFAAGATSGVPYAFKLIIDRGFSGGGDIARWF
ncbi:MAG TPA: ABC transporter, partial [Rhizorhapis sp.]|nr:ABC transporter [Rhizorhapis sp.]